MVTPIGAILTKDEVIVATGFNQPIHTVDPTAHAELVAIRQAAKELGDYRLRGLTLYVTVEPCLMCVGAILLHHIGRVMYGSADNYGGASLVFGHTPTYFEEEISKIEWIGPSYPEECDKLFVRLMKLVMEWREKDN